MLSRSEQTDLARSIVRRLDSVSGTILAVSQKPTDREQTSMRLFSKKRRDRVQLDEIERDIACYSVLTFPLML